MNKECARYKAADHVVKKKLKWGVLSVYRVPEKALGSTASQNRHWIHTYIK